MPQVRRTLVARLGWRPRQQRTAPAWMLPELQAWASTTGLTTSKRTKQSDTPSVNRSHPSIARFIASLSGRYTAVHAAPKKSSRPRLLAVEGLAVEGAGAGAADGASNVLKISSSPGQHTRGRTHAVTRITCQWLQAPGELAMAVTNDGAAAPYLLGFAAGFAAGAGAAGAVLGRGPLLHTYSNSDSALCTRSFSSSSADSVEPSDDVISSISFGCVSRRDTT